MTAAKSPNKRRLKCLKPRVGKEPQSRLASADHKRQHKTGSTTWRKIRERVLTRDCGMCVLCQESGRLTLAVEVDHRTPAWAGGTDDDGNLQSLCKPCHTDKTTIEAQRRAAGGLDY